MSETLVSDEQKSGYLLPDWQKQVSMSLSIKDYNERDLGSSSSIFAYVSFPSEQKSRYEGLKKLIEGWLEEPGDYDASVWPEIEKNLANQKIRFRETFD